MLLGQHRQSSQGAAMGAKPFVTDIENIRRRARQHIEKGAITEGYKADRKTVIKILNEALATEIVCVLRYKYHYRSEEHTSELQSLLRISYAVFCLNKQPSKKPQSPTTCRHT